MKTRLRSTQKPIFYRCPTLKLRAASLVQMFLFSHMIGPKWPDEFQRYQARAENLCLYFQTITTGAGAQRRAPKNVKPVTESLIV